MKDFYLTWLAGTIVMLPLTALTSCQLGFLLSGELKLGLIVWFSEAAALGLFLALTRE